MREVEIAVQEIVDAVKRLEEGNLPNSTGFLTDTGCGTEEHPDVVRVLEAVERHMDTLFSRGRINPIPQLALMKHKVFLSPGEVDSFGCLTAEITTKKGSIVFDSW